jgi:nucleoside-diphosphate-sugar epimerase
MRIVLTGAVGYLGSVIASELKLRHHEVIGFVRRMPVGKVDYHLIEVELTDEAAVASAVTASRPDAVIHCAGRTLGNAFELYRDNTVATVVLADAILANAPAAILTALGSAAEYGRRSSSSPIKECDACRPIGTYGHAKLAASQYLASVALRGLRHNLVRPFNLVGTTNSPHQVIGSFLEKAQRARMHRAAVHMGRLDAVRDFVAVGDLVRLILNLVEGRRQGEVVNACSGVGRRVRDLVEFLATRADPPIEVIEEEVPPGFDAPPDIAIGDPTHFFSVAEIQHATSVEGVLETAWHAAEAARLQGKPAVDHSAYDS